MNAIDNAVYGAINRKTFASEIELPAKVKQNFIYVQQSIKALLLEGKIVLVGEHYSDKFNKIFNYYTSQLDRAPLIKVQIANKAKPAQIRKLVSHLVKSVEEHNNTIIVKAEKELILEGKLKKDPAFHLLHVEDFIFCYDLVIEWGISAEIRLAEINKNRKKTTKQAA